MNHTAALLSLATSVPPHQFDQKQVLSVALGVMSGRLAEFEAVESLFANTGIRHRYAVKPIEWYIEQRGWPERTSAFLEGAETLFLDVARKAIARADLAAGDVNTVVTVCSTGIATPTLEARVASQMGFRSDVARVPLFGLGWAARAGCRDWRLRRGSRKRGPVPTCCWLHWSFARLPFAMTR